MSEEVPNKTRGRKADTRVFLNKKDLIKLMQEKYISHLGVTNKLVDEILDGFFEAFKEALVENQRIELYNFGIVRQELVRGKLITHPVLRTEMISPPYYKITYKPAKEVRELLRKKAIEEAKQV